MLIDSELWNFGVHVIQGFSFCLQKKKKKKPADGGLWITFVSWERRAWCGRHDPLQGSVAVGDNGWAPWEGKKSWVVVRFEQVQLLTENRPEWERTELFMGIAGEAGVNRKSNFMLWALLLHCQQQ